MTDYNALKVPELKKLLGDRSLPLSGNKADLIARLQEADKGTSNGAAAGAAEDEIDWDEDDAKATTAPAAAAVAAGGSGQVANPVAVPNQKLDVDPAKTSDLKVAGGEKAPEPGEGAVAPAAATSTEAAPAPAPKQDYSMGIQKTDAEKEAERRAARAKRFGIPEDTEEQKLLERAKKFGTDTAGVTKGLDDALPERPLKRGREGAEKQGGRGAKRQTPDRRTEAPPAKAAKVAKAAPPKKSLGVLSDPKEAEKAAARAARFAMS